MNTGVVPLVGCMGVGRTPLYRGGWLWAHPHPHDFNFGRWQQSLNGTFMGLKAFELQRHINLHVSVHRRQLIRYECNMRAVPHDAPPNFPKLRRFSEHKHFLPCRVGRNSQKNIICMLCVSCRLSGVRGLRDGGRTRSYKLSQNRSAFQTNAILHPPGDAVKQTMQHI